MGRGSESGGVGLPRPGGRPLSRRGPSLTHLLFAHLIAEVLDVLALVEIATQFGKRVITGIAPVVPGAAQHR